MPWQRNGSSARHMQATHTQEPRVINVDKNAAYPKAIDEMKAEEELSKSVELRQNKYLNNRVNTVRLSLNLSSVTLAG